MGRHERSHDQGHDRITDPADLHETGEGKHHQGAKHVGNAAVDRSVAVRPPKPYRIAGTIAPEVIAPLPVVTRSFEEARQKTKKAFSDTFIDGALDGTLTVGDEKVYFMKSYFDQVPMTPGDMEVVEDPHRAARLYRETTEMLFRNLKVFMPNSATEAHKKRIAGIKNDYIASLGDYLPEAEAGIVAWCRDRSNKYPVAAIEYKGFVVDGKDMLDAATVEPDDAFTNFKIQRGLNAPFIMAYSDGRLRDRKSKVRDHEPDRRIYLNPEAEATPKVFEQILQMANKEGLSLQLKMLQRAHELAVEHGRTKKEDYTPGNIRGDGIVVYINHDIEDRALAEILKVVESNAGAFRGRGVSRMPLKIADGVAIGDEPAGVKGKESLTSHRVELIEEALSLTRQAGLSGEPRRDYFRSTFRRLARARHVDPDNFAFNS